MKVYIVSTINYYPKNRISECDVCWSMFNETDKKHLKDVEYKRGGNMWFTYYHCAEKPEDCIMKDDLQPNYPLYREFLTNVMEIFGLNEDNCQFDTHILKTCSRCVRIISSDVLSYDYQSGKNIHIQGPPINFLRNGSIETTVIESTRKMSRTKKAAK